MDQMHELPEYEDLTTAKVFPSPPISMRKKLSKIKVKSGREKLLLPPIPGEASKTTSLKYDFGRFLHFTVQVSIPSFFHFILLMTSNTSIVALPIRSMILTLFWRTGVFFLGSLMMSMSILLLFWWKRFRSGSKSSAFLVLFRQTTYSDIFS